MKYLGDITEDATIRGSFNTRTAAGAPITLAGTPSVAVYKDGGTTEITAGVTLTVDFDSRTGHHVFTIDTSADAAYSTGSDYRVVITAGTVDGTSVVGVEVGSFSIQNRYMRGTDSVTALDAAGVRSAIGMSSANLDTQLGAIVADTNELQTNQGNWLTATGFSTHSAADVVTAMGTGTFLTAIPWNPAWDAEVQSECSDAITSYDPPTYTELLNLVRLMVRKDSGVASDLSSVISDINADLGSGGGNYTLQNDSLEALRDRGDSAWITATGFSTLDAAGIRTAVGLSSANLDTQLGAIVADTNELQVNQGNWLTADISGLATAAALATVDTVVDGIKAVTDKVDTSLESDGASGYQFTTLALENAPAGGGGGDATEANQTTIINHLTAIKGAGFDTSTDSLQAIRDRGDAAWTSSSGGSGARTVTITVVDDAAVAVNRAQVNVFSSAGDPIGIYGDTNSSGIVTFNLNDGNYKLAVTDMAGYESHTAEAFTVSSGSTTATIELTLTPTSGASYALKVSYSELRREVGRHLGFNRDPSSWEANEIQDVADIIKSGQWHFYWPPAIDQATPFQTHQWSFLCVSYQISLVAGTVAYELPDDFVRMQSGFTFGNDGNQFRISVIDDETLRSMQSKSYLTGTPHYVAIRARNNRLDEGYELAFYPTPDMAYTIDFRYEKLPNEITSVNPYHLGPAVHSKLLLSACLMEADRKLNPETMSPDGGLHAQQFFRQLRASIAVDRQAIGMSS